MSTGTLFIVSAPSGAGKTSLVAELLAVVQQQLRAEADPQQRDAAAGRVGQRLIRRVNPLEQLIGDLQQALTFGN